MKVLLFNACAALVLMIALMPASATSQTVASQKNKPSAPTPTKPAPTVSKIPVKPAATAAATTPTKTLVPAALTLEQQVLDEINQARREPKKYVQYLEEYKKTFKGIAVPLPNSMWLETREGVVPVDEAIGDLTKLSPLGAYSFSSGLNKVVGLHLVDLKGNPALSHRGKDGSDLATRLARGGTVGGNYAENVVRSAYNARDVVVMMLVDDGFQSRSHRRNILSPNFKVVGIACDKSTTGEVTCVTNFAEGYSERGAAAKGVTREL